MRARIEESGSEREYFLYAVDTKDPDRDFGSLTVKNDMLDGVVGAARRLSLARLYSYNRCTQPW